MGAENQVSSWRCWVAFSLFAPFAAGCASTMDRISSSRFRDAPFETLFGHDEPMEVLRKSQDPNERAAAILELKEPKRNGGTDAEQAEALKYLADMATSDKQPYCRKCALSTLGRWEDPRTSQIIVMAFQNAPNETPLEKRNPEAEVVQVGRRSRALEPVSSYTAPTIVTMRCRALESLGKKQSPEGLTLLCQTASTPAQRDTKPLDFDLQYPGNSGQDQQDLRLAAIRGLAHYKGDLTAARTLYRVMTTEHDVGLKNRAYISLGEVTDKSFPPDSAEWKSFLRMNEAPPASPPAGYIGTNGIQPVGGRSAAPPVNNPTAAPPIGNAGPAVNAVPPMPPTYSGTGAYPATAISATAAPTVNWTPAGNGRVQPANNSVPPR